MLEILKGLFLGGGGTLGAITGTAKVLTLATLAPLAWHWFNGHAQEVVYTVHVDDAVMLLTASAGLLFAAHKAAP